MRAKGPVVSRRGRNTLPVLMQASLTRVRSTARTSRRVGPDGKDDWLGLQSYPSRSVTLRIIRDYASSSGLDCQIAEGIGDGAVTILGCVLVTERGSGVGMTAAAHEFRH
jgi:hypothetical protein